MKKIEFIKNEEKHRPIVYQIYKHLKKECVGYDNRQKAWEIQKVFGIKDNEQFREYINEIRRSDVLQKFVCSQAGATGGYWIATNREETMMTMDHLYYRAMDMLKTVGTLKRKAKLNNQMRLKFSEYEKTIYESLMEEENK